MPCVFVTMPHGYVIVPHGYLVIPHVYVIIPHEYVRVPHVYGTVPHVYRTVRHEYRTVLHGYKMLRMYSAHGRGIINGSCYFSPSECPRFDSYLDKNTRTIELFSLCCEITCLENGSILCLG